MSRIFRFSLNRFQFTWFLSKFSQFFWIQFFLFTCFLFIYFRWKNNTLVGTKKMNFILKIELNIENQQNNKIWKEIGPLFNLIFIGNNAFYNIKNHIYTYTRITFTFYSYFILHVPSCKCAFLLSIFYSTLSTKCQRKYCQKCTYKKWKYFKNSLRWFVFG